MTTGTGNAGPDPGAQTITHPTQEELVAEAAALALATQHQPAVAVQ